MATTWRSHLCFSYQRSRSFLDELRHGRGGDAAAFGFKRVPCAPNGFAEATGFEFCFFCPYFFLARRVLFCLSSENSHFNNLAGLNGLQRGERLGHMRPNIIEIIRCHTDNQNSDASASDVLLMPDVLIYGDQDFKLFLASAMSSPFSLPLNPASRTVSHSCPASKKRNFALRGKHSSRSNFISESQLS